MPEIVLDYPVTVAGKEHKTLTMRRPKVKDQKAAQKMGGSDDEREIMLFANLCDVTPDVIDELDMADYGAVQETYSGFLSRRQEMSGKQPGS